MIWSIFLQTTSSMLTKSWEKYSWYCWRRQFLNANNCEIGWPKNCQCNSVNGKYCQAKANGFTVMNLFQYLKLSPHNLIVTHVIIHGVVMNHAESLFRVPAWKKKNFLCDELMFCKFWFAKFIYLLILYAYLPSRV